VARVVGVKEKLHSPMYDAFFVKPGERFADVMTDPRMIRFFVDVQNKTRLETNLQASGVLPSQNTFEARAMRVIVSNPHCGREDIVRAGDDYSSDVKQAKDDGSKRKVQDDFVGKVHAMCGGSSLALAELIYNSVTTLLVGEKIMIEMPTYYFPSGAGVSPGNGAAFNHGEPDPLATFRFSEPVIVERHQSFRVEMLFPQAVPSTVANLTGPLRIWVVLDGYLTRDVQ
jgi:hypothetical protein